MDLDHLKRAIQVHGNFASSSNMGRRMLEGPRHPGTEAILELVSRLLIGFVRDAGQFPAIEPDEQAVVTSVHYNVARPSV